MTTTFLIIKMKDYIVKTTRTSAGRLGLCELSEIAETFSIVYFSGAVDELPSSMNSRGNERYHTDKEKSFPEWRPFSKINFVTCRSTYHSSCYRIES